MNTTRTTAFKVGLAWIAMLLGAHQAFAQLPSVTLRVTDAVASEPGTDTATFCVSRTGSLDAPLTVFYGVGGTASNGVDYVTLPNNVNIPAGASNATVVVQPVDDSIAESPETIILTLTTNAAYALASPSSATATLLDNDNLPPTVAIVSPDNLAVITGPTNIVVTAQVSDADGWIRNVNFYNNGVYIGSSGYANSSNPASAGSVTTCSVLMTNVISGHFTLSASAYDNLNLMVTSTPVNVTVTQDLSVAVVKVVATDYRASEPGADTGVFTVSRIGNINQDISVFYTVGGTAASGSDYTSLPGSVRIPAGATNATILIQPIDDTIVEPAETVILTLSLDPAYVLGDGRTATVYIYDNETNTPPAVTLTSPANGSSFLDPTNILLTADAADIDGAVTRVDFYANGVSVGYKTNAPFSAMWYGMPMGSYTLTAKATDNMGATTTSQPVVVTIARTPLVNVSVLDSTGSEPGTDTATILVSRSNNTNSDLAVNYTVAGTATPGVDYVALSGSVTIPAGVASVSIVIQPIDDTIQEPTETVTVNLSTNSTYMLGSYRSATVYILDNETNQPPVVAITSPLAGASFTDPSGILVTAGASDPDGSVTRVDFYANGMLIGYKTSTPYTVTWYSMPMGSYALTARATDNFGMVTTSQPVNVTVVRSPVVYLTVLDGYASEPGSDTATIQVNRSNNTNMDLVVNYTVSGTATPGVDYESLPGSVTIPAGVSSVPIAIRPIDDTLQELTETVIVTLSSNASSSIGSPGSACVYIRDDETNTPPAVELTAPTNGASFSDPSTIVLTASATDAEGAVTRVDFYVNGALLSYKTNAPFTASWYGMPQGVYTLTAKATDNLGAATTSQPVSVMVNRTPVVSLSVPDGSASEPGSDTATIQVNRSNNTNTALVVNYTVSGTATSGVDYEALPGSVTIPAGASSVPIVIRPIDDTLLEPTETVIVTLSSNSPYMLADLRSACVYILDNETNQPPAIVLTTPTNGASFYDPTNILMAADATDVDGVVTRVDFFVNNLLIATDTNAPFTAVWGGMMQGIYTLTARATDNLGAATVSPPVTVNVIRTPSLRITALDAYAGETAGDTATVQVYRYYNTNLDLVVNYTIGGTASNGVDHVTLPGSVIIPAGQCSANIVIQPIDDTLVEPTETITLTLVPASNCLLSDPRSATVYIRDNDTNTPPTIALTAPADGSVLTDPTNILVTADASDTDGSVVRVDFLINNVLIGSVTSAPYSVKWSGMVQGTYQLVAKATDNIGASMASQPVNVSIVRTPVLQLTATDTHASEVGNDTGMFTIYRYENTNQSVTAHYVVSGTASNGADYVFLPGTVTIPAGATSTTILVQPLDDGIDVEPSVETVTLALLPDVAYRIGSASQGAVYIYNQVTANIPPSVYLVTPTNGTTINIPATVALRAEAADSDGSIARVDFLVNNAVIGSTTNAPYTCSWSATSVGYFILIARATDNRGAITMSTPIRVVTTPIPAPTATRYLPVGYIPGINLLVMISVAKPSGVGAYMVAEQPPKDWPVSGIRGVGSYDPTEGIIHFGPITNASQMFYYELTPPQTAVGTQTFSGTIATEKVSVPVGGAATISPIPPHPADNAPADFDMTLVEAGAYADAWLHPVSASSNPSPAGATVNTTSSSLVSYVARGGYLWRHGGAYTVSTNCPTPQPPMVWVPTAGTPVMPLYSSTGYGTAISSLSTSFVPSLPFTVTIAVTPASTSSVFAIEEHMPSGWVVSNVSDQGVFSSTTASVRWGLFVDGQACTVSYDVTPPTNAASYGVFSGVVSFDGVNVPITGTRKTVRTSP